MPWPLTSSSKPKARPASSGDVLNDISALALEDPRDSGFYDRRSASLDISRPSLHNTSLKAVQNDAKRARRSSFPRLALPSWRTTAGNKNGQDGSAMEDGDVELVSGHATPFSANGQRGGFVPDDVSLSSRGGSSIRSGSIRSSAYDNDDDEEEGERDGSLRIGRSSRTNVMVSPWLTPVDSGFSEFGPDSIVEEEEQRQNQANRSAETRKGALSESTMAGEGKSAEATGNSKRRSKGWFSFSSDKNGAATPTAEDPKSFMLDAPEPVMSAPHPNAQTATSRTPKDQKSSVSAKPATVSKGVLGIGSRRRGNSEVSMRNIGDDQ